jgi:hypothetical protein
VRQELSEAGALLAAPAPGSRQRESVTHADDANQWSIGPAGKPVVPVHALTDFVAPDEVEDHGSVEEDAL